MRKGVEGKPRYMEMTQIEKLVKVPKRSLYPEAVDF